MKAIEREQARALRREGQSIKEICRALGVSKSSVSVWVRDIALTDAQIERLEEKGAFTRRQGYGAKVIYEKHFRLREQYQREGRAKAREGDPLHLAGCMLYWGEGSKHRVNVNFTNADPDMITFFMCFLRESLCLRDDEIVLRVMCYTNNGLSQEQIETFWLEKTGLTRQQMRRTTIDMQPRSSKQGGRKLMYGVCVIGVYKVRVMQHIYGAIQEYTGIDKPEWLL